MQSQPSTTLWSRLREGILGLRKPVAPEADAAKLEEALVRLRKEVPAPVFWLFGKTQSGKTSVVRTLTGADDAAIGNGFRPCTLTSRIYPFPSEAAPVVTFLDTRGVDEPSYDATEDIARFNEQAHLVLVTCRLKDFATGRVKESLARIRAADPSRPVVLVLTCLHEAYPQQQHPIPYPFDAGVYPPSVSDGPWPGDLIRLVREQTEEFRGLVDRVVPVDLTQADEGYAETEYGGAMLKQVLRETLPAAYRATFRRVVEVDPNQLNDEHKRARPVVLGYATLAATAAGLPLTNWLVVPNIQERMLAELAARSGRGGAATAFLEKVGGWSSRTNSRLRLTEFLRIVPVVGTAANIRMAGKTTYALGLAFITYLHETRLGHALTDAMIQKLYEKEFQMADTAWSTTT